MIPTESSRINRRRAGCVLIVWIALKRGEHSICRQRIRSGLCFNACMIGHKAFHHVHPIADSIASPWQVSDPGSVGAFPGVVVRELWLSKTRMERCESASGQVCHGRADESDYILRSPDCDPCYSEFSCQGKLSPDCSEDRQPRAA